MTNNASPTWVPELCSLPTAERPLRVAEFDRLFAKSVVRLTRRSATNLDLLLSGDVEAQARDLAAREAGCCSFFSFGFEAAGSDLVMSITVPKSQATVLDAIAARVNAVAADGTGSER